MEFRRSFRLSRSHHIVLSSESVNSDCARIAGYERLSKTMRVSGQYDFNGHKHKKRKRGIGLLGKVFYFTRISSPHEEPKVEDPVVKKEKKRSSWLPDPDRRWPIQGW